MKTLAEKIAVMQAAERGEQIERCSITGPDPIWEKVEHQWIGWDWCRCDYRVAKQKKTYWIYVSEIPSPVKWCSSLYETLPVGISSDGMTKTISGKWHKITIEE